MSTDMRNSHRILPPSVKQLQNMGISVFDSQTLEEIPVSPDVEVTPGFQEIPATPIADLQARVHGANLKWWKDLNTGAHLDRNKGEMLALIHSEISECLEGIRKNLMDDKLPHRKMEEVELADAMIRILDYAGGFKLDLQGAFEDKMAYNATRADHDPENRRGTHGKKF